jgi:REP element-mobilizing transposase RayT
MPMARPLRVEYPGAFYHVMNRSGGGEEVFVRNANIERFLQNLEKAVERFSTVIHAFCLMPTHYHLLLQTPEPNLSATIQWLNVSYAAYYNKNHDRKGHLFQGRFKAILVDGDEYLKELSRYIHLNPVRARMVAKPDEYRWSSYPAYVGKVKPPHWLEVKWLLGCFGEKPKESARSYRSFVEGVDMDSLRNPHDEVVEGFVLGDSAFVEWVRDTCLRGREEDGEIPQLGKLIPRPALERIAGEVSQALGCGEETIRRKGSKSDIGRDMAIYLARDCAGVSCKDLGRFFGEVSGAAITMRYKDMCQRMEHDQRLRKRVDEIRKRILNI